MPTMSPSFLPFRIVIEEIGNKWIMNEKPTKKTANLLTETQFWIFATIIAIVIVLVSRKLLVG